MKKPVIISVDSTCDLPAEILERYDIKLIPLTIVLGEESYLDGQLSPMDIYARYEADGLLPKTSAVGIMEFSDYFRSFTEKGFEIVHFDISSELSATYNNARLAASELDGVYTIDSKMLSTGLGLLVVLAAECRDKGMSAGEIVDYILPLLEKVETSFVLDTLEFMWKGGRCSGVAALGANLLKLKPAIEMKGGKLGVYKKYRGNINSVYKQYIKERLVGKDICPEHLFLTHSGGVSEETLNELVALIKGFLPDANIHHAIAGCTVSCHCGKGTLGIIFINK